MKKIFLSFIFIATLIAENNFDSFFQIFQYRNIGPTRGGRATAVEGVTKDLGTFYMGATGGGVWKTQDYGITWNNISDNYFESPSIGAITVYQKDPNVLYVGQGMNGGKTWEKVLFISDTVGVVDIEFAPDDPNTIYAGTWRTERKPWTIISGGLNGGIYKSTNGGSSWKKINRGLPKGLIGKIDLAVSQDDPDRLYALVEAPKGEGGLYRSNNRGESFKLVKTDPKDVRHLVNRPFYYINISSNPKNADILFSNANRFMRSDDGGKNWRILSTPHGDNHDIWIHPQETSLWVQ